MSLQLCTLLVFCTSQWACLPNLAPKKLKLVEHASSGAVAETWVSSQISFDEGTETYYDFDRAAIELASGLVRLKELPAPPESEDGQDGMTFGIPGGASGSEGTVEGPSVQYPNIQPTIFLRSPIQFSRIVDLTEVLGPAGCPAGVRYTISVDGMFWFYFNGLQWSPSDGSITQANSAEGLKEGFSLLTSSFAEDFYIRAHLNSSGSEPCELDQILIRGKK